MSRLWFSRGWAIAWLGVVTCGCFAPIHAADLSGFSPSYSGTQVKVYLSWSFAAHGAHSETFGFRYERSSPVSGDPATRFCAPLAHRSLVDLQFSRGAGPRMQFGPRVTWDISRGRISPTSLAKTWLVAMPTAPSLVGSAWTP